MPKPTTLLAVAFGLAVDPAEVAVPSDGDNVGKQDAVLKRQKGKVDGLNKGPHQPVCLEGGPPRRLQTLLCARSLHGGHAAEEGTNHDGGKQGLVAGNTGERLYPWVSERDVAGQESEPCRGDRAEEASSVQGHAAGPGQVVALETLAFDQLLRGNVSSREEYRSGDALCEEGTGSQPGIVPTQQRNNHFAQETGSKGVGSKTGTKQMRKRLLEPDAFAVVQNGGKNNK